MHVRSNSSPALVFSLRILRGNPNILVIYHQIFAQLKFREHKLNSCLCVWNTAHFRVIFKASPCVESCSQTRHHHPHSFSCNLWIERSDAWSQTGHTRFQSAFPAKWLNRKRNRAKTVRKGKGRFTNTNSSTGNWKVCNFLHRWDSLEHFTMMLLDLNIESRAGSTWKHVEAVVPTEISPSG